MLTIAVRGEFKIVVLTIVCWAGVNVQFMQKSYRSIIHVTHVELVCFPWINFSCRQDDFWSVDTLTLNNAHSSLSICIYRCLAVEFVFFLFTFVQTVVLFQPDGLWGPA